MPTRAKPHYPALAKELHAALGRDFQDADVFKLSHHASKHGINLELLERVDAPYTLISASDGHGRYKFPHRLAMEAAREARQPTTSKPTEPAPDYELGIHLTGARLGGNGRSALGTIAVLVPRAAGSPIRMFRLMDDLAKNIDLAAAREL